MGRRTRKQTVFDRYDRILIDASSLMNYEALELFLAGNGDGIRNSGRGILITHVQHACRPGDTGHAGQREKALQAAPDHE